MGYMLVIGLGLWILCGYLGVEWFRQYMKKEYEVSDEDFDLSISSFCILTGPTTIVATFATIAKDKMRK